MDDTGSSKVNEQKTSSSFGSFGLAYAIACIRAFCHRKYIQQLIIHLHGLAVWGVLIVKKQKEEGNSTVLIFMFSFFFVSHDWCFLFPYCVHFNIFSGANLKSRHGFHNSNENVLFWCFVLLCVCLLRMCPCENVDAM